MTYTFSTSDVFLQNTVMEWCEWPGERRNHSLKYMNQTVYSHELVIKYESWKVLREIVPYEFLSSTPQPNREILFQNKFSIPLCLSYENCKRPRRNYTPKRENCFAIFISVCNSHVMTPDFIRTRLHMDSHVAMNLNSELHVNTVLCGRDKEKLELSKIV